MTDTTATDTAPWDGATYQRIAAPQTAWGERVLSQLSLVGDERVLDAGCGSGKLTASLLARLPRGEVIALDASASMLAEARRTLNGLGLRVSFVQADLLAFSLPDPQRVDVVFSTATFHWVLDHDALFARLFAALRPGGRLLAQCGGAGNLSGLYQRASIVRAQPSFSTYFEGFREPLYFATPGETAQRLEAAGFTEIVTSLEDAPTPFADEASFRVFVASVCLRHDLEALPVELHPAFLGQVSDAAGAASPPFVLDYVRLNLSARRPG